MLKFKLYANQTLGSASFNSGGVTIHKLLHLGYNYRKSNQRKSKALSKVSVYIFDEMSLIRNYKNYIGLKSDSKLH